MTAKEPDRAEAMVVQVPDKFILLVIAAYAAAFVAFGVAVDGPAAVGRGLLAIITTRDALLTDCFGSGAVKPPPARAQSSVVR